MRRSDPPPIPRDVADALDALPPDERGALRATWARLEAPTAPSPDAQRKAATWAHLKDAVQPGRPGRTDRAPRRRAAANAPLWRLYASGVVASVVLLVGLGWWLTPATTFVAHNAPRTLTLDDGSTVTLAPGSTLHLDAPWPETRAVTLDGTARFAVEHDGRRPFTVTTPQATVTVLGTVFTVYARQRDATRVQVESGRVAVARGAQEVVLTADEQVIAHPEQPFAVRMIPTAPAARFHFEDAPARALFDEIEALFGLTVTAPPEADAARITLTRHGPLDAEALVQSICASLGWTYRSTADGFEVQAR